jgi:hypothetical protein
MDHHGVTLAHEGGQGLQLGPSGVLAGGLVREGAVNLYLVELTL